MGPLILAMPGAVARFMPGFWPLALLISSHRRAPRGRAAGRARDGSAFAGRRGSCGVATSSWISGWAVLALSGARSSAPARLTACAALVPALLCKSWRW